jgi:hypothetical protein
MVKLKSGGLFLIARAEWWLKLGKEPGITLIGSINLHFFLLGILRKVGIIAQDVYAVFPKPIKTKSA